MFKFLQDLPTSEVLNATHQAMRLLQHRVKPTVARWRVVGKARSSTVTPQEFKLALQIVKEIEAIEGCSISSVRPQRVQRYVVQLADLVQERVKGESRVTPAKARYLLERLKKYGPTLGAKDYKRRKSLRNRTRKASAEIVV